MLERLAEIEAHYDELTKQLSDPEVLADHRRVEKISRERSSLETVVRLFKQYRETQQALDEARALLSDSDAEMKQLGREEEARLAPELERLDEELKVALLPKDPADEKDVIVEIRSGTGGDEAGLFASDLFRMYQRYTERQGWTIEILNTSFSTGGGYKEITFGVHGRGAFSQLKHESGVHRVQRVPETESQGRIHTSTATVAVLPEAVDVEIDLDWNDVRIDIFHAGGAGGQNVNKVATAVRMTHAPSGVVVTCQDERSQAKNKMRAETVLRARLYEIERERADREESETRRAQVGSGSRSEKIRTYNYPQDRITDHRINLTVHNIPRVMDGEIDELIEAVAQDEQARALAATS